MAASEIATQSAFPKKRIQPMFRNGLTIEIGEDIEGPSFPKPQFAARRHTPLLFFRLSFGSCCCRCTVLLRDGTQRPMIGRCSRRPYPVHHDHRPVDLDRVDRNFGFARTFRGGVLYGGTSCRETQKGSQCEFQFPVHGRSVDDFDGTNIENLFRRRKNMPKSFDGACFLRYFVLHLII